MKINRLLQITILLLNKGTVTAKELSARFEVSTRTIYRDIDVLSAAGVPVYANRGAGGGIALLENYTLNKTLLTSRESESILFALKTLRATQYPEIDDILDKLGALFHNADDDWIQIDFTPWDSNPNEYDKLNTIKKAILGRCCLEFDYINTRTERAVRRIEPLKLIFRGRSWYLRGWDLTRCDYRMFRISRIKRVHLTGILFDRDKSREPRQQEQSEADRTAPMIRMELKFATEVLHRLYDDYDDDTIMTNPNGDGTYIVHVEYPENEWLYGHILSFGPYVEVLAPEHIKRIIKDKAEKIAGQYQ